MPTALKLGPADHGRPLTLEEFETGDYEPGYKYELIEGSLYVSPTPNPPEDMVCWWVYEWLRQYSRQHPEVLNHLTMRGQIVIPDDPDGTRPEPDVVAFRDYPRHLPFAELRWRDFHPAVVVEVLGSDPDKDLRRNVDLYLRHPSIREYWVFDIRTDPDRPLLIARRRYGNRWVVREVDHGETYTSRHLPEFELINDPRRYPES